MVGRDVILELEKGPAHPGARAACATRGADDRGVVTVSGLDLEVRAGEILGIAGVEGNGQRELVEAMAGMRPASAARSRSTAPTSPTRAPREVSDAGVGHVPEDRTKHGVVGDIHASPTTSC